MEISAALKAKLETDKMAADFMLANPPAKPSRLWIQGPLLGIAALVALQDCYRFPREVSTWFFLIAVGYCIEMVRHQHKLHNTYTSAIAIIKSYRDLVSKGD